MYNRCIFILKHFLDITVYVNIEVKTIKNELFRFLIY